MSGTPRLSAAAYGGAALLLLGAALLPVDSLVDTLSRRFNTVRSFPDDFSRGLQALRLALAANGMLLLLLPRALRRADLRAGAASLPERADLRAGGVLWLLSALLALPGLFESFQDDEWRVLEQYIRHGPLVILSRSGADNHQLQSLLSWPFIALFGVSEVAVRLPVLLLTTLSPALLFLLLRREHPRATAFAAALPLALSPYLLQYAAEGRGYGPLLACILGLAWVREPLAAGSRRAWIASSLLGAAAVLFHLFAAPVVLALAIPLRREDRGPERLWRLGSALAVSAGLALLVSAPTLPQVLGYRSERLDAADSGSLFAPAELFSFPLPYILALAALPALACSKRGLLLPVLFAAGFQAVLIAATHAGHSSRFYVASAALGWVAVGTGAAAGFRSGKPLGRSALPALLLLGVAADIAHFRSGRRDYRTAAHELQKRRAPGESLAVLFDGRPLNAYLPGGVDVLTVDALLKRRPDWFLVVDLNIPLDARLKPWLEAGYDRQFGLPSTRGELGAYRRRAP